MIRRVVNLVVHKTSTGVHSVHRIDPYKHLFYRSADEAAAAANAKKRVDNVDRTMGMQTLVLPDQAVSFAPSPELRRDSLDLFGLLGTRGSEGRIVRADRDGEAVLYDADERLFLNLPRLNQPKGLRPVCISVALPGAPENSLYAMEWCIGERTIRTSYPFAEDQDRIRSCFEVLEYGPRHSGWRWRTLPPPPFVLRPGLEPSDVAAYACTVNANGCSTIYVSWEDEWRSAMGTYCFDTSRDREEWHRVGDWNLPLLGGAHYVPEFDLWFGFSARSPNFHLCALDLSAMALNHQQPVVQHVFEDLNLPAENLSLMTAELVSLGAGKFCVARCFEAYETTGLKFAVLIGIEIVRDHDRGLRMVRHKCTRYYFLKNDMINWVF